AINVCDEEFKKLPEDDLVTSISMWKKLSLECSGTGIYEVRLAALYMDLGDYEKALPIIESGMELDSDYEKELLAILASCYMGTRSFEQADEVVNKIILKYADWYRGYYLLSILKAHYGDFREALIAINKANNLKEHPQYYSMMAYYFHRVEEHGYAAGAMAKAIDLDNNEIKRLLPVVATAYSFISLGRIERAEELLHYHQIAVPASKNDPDFVKVIAYLRKKKAEGEVAD
ncbi:MAG TPA: hypothetical protein DCS49_03320, partial [Gammaproteobacteria bacterium]|nr:hypothetical protein [Gammaproteobacteria bacterium]